MANYTYERLRGNYSTKWDNMVIHSSRRPGLEQVADKIIKHKDIYKDLESKTGVPWYFIGMLHLRESNCNFNRHLHNGDPLSGRTYRVPAGRPLGKPPFSFEESAIDALKMKGYDKVKNWTIEQCAYRSEQFNGFGYQARGIPSPYLWSGTNQYVRGKYVADHVFDPSVADVQPGVMPVFKIILEKTGEAVPEEDMSVVAAQAPKAIPAPPTTKELTKVSRKSYATNWIQRIATWLGLGGTVTYKIADSMSLESTKTAVDTIKQTADTVGAWGIIAVAIAAIAFCIYMQYLMKKDIVEGRATPSEGNPPIGDTTNAVPDDTA